uniref:AtPDCT1/2 transmembrane domain-containing protein n=1 Tax=Triticum urartu TaxID=4572 RepID=A0A8R7R7D1_TRIUA
MRPSHVQVFVAMQAAYILWAVLAEQRPRAAIATLMMFTCRGLLGCSTQLPLPAEFLGSGMDFPMGNVSFFLFYSGHVAGAVIASIDMRRVGRRRLAVLYDTLNLLQFVRLLACRGHYTIDLAVGVGAGPSHDVVKRRPVNCNTTHYRANSSSVPGDPLESTCRHASLHHRAINGRGIAVDWTIQVIF